MIFEPAERIADAILYEGYILYPYRASAAKNQVRWQFGVLAPKSPRGGGEPWFSETECLVERSETTTLRVRARFLQPRLRPPEADGRAWLDAVPGTIDVEAIDLGRLPVSCGAPLIGSDRAAVLRVEAAAAGRFATLRLRLENLEPWCPEFASDRDRMLQHSLVAAHLLLAVEEGAFVSLLEPPADAAPLVAACRNRHTWPVLAGDRRRRNLMLSSPIVLYDYPAVANESPGDLCDAAEIDEMLSLRIMTLTADEKREARATDPIARTIIDRVDNLTPDALAALHGAMRSADFFNPEGMPPSDQATVEVGGVCIRKGSHVRLRPTRRADSMDMFLRDQPATVAGVYRDVDDRVYVAVTVDADPAAALHESFGRFFYFDPDEIEPIASGEERV